MQDEVWQRYDALAKLAALYAADPAERPEISNQIDSHLRELPGPALLDLAKSLAFVMGRCDVFAERAGKRTARSDATDGSESDESSRFVARSTSFERLRSLARKYAARPRERPRLSNAIDRVLSSLDEPALRELAADRRLPVVQRRAEVFAQRAAKKARTALRNAKHSASDGGSRVAEPPVVNEPEVSQTSITTTREAERAAAVESNSGPKGTPTPQDGFTPAASDHAVNGLGAEKVRTKKPSPAEVRLKIKNRKESRLARNKWLQKEAERADRRRRMKERHFRDRLRDFSFERVLRVIERAQGWQLEIGIEVLVGRWPLAASTVTEESLRQMSKSTILPWLSKAANRELERRRLATTTAANVPQWLQTVRGMTLPQLQLLSEGRLNGLPSAAANEAQRLLGWLADLRNAHTESLLLRLEAHDEAYPIHIVHEVLREREPDEVYRVRNKVLDRRMCPSSDEILDDSKRPRWT